MAKNTISNEYRMYLARKVGWTMSLVSYWSYRKKGFKLDDILQMERRTGKHERFKK